jgi:hypothetical protein
MFIISNLIKGKLSDFLINVSASYFIAAFISQGFFGRNIINYFIAFIYDLLLAIIYFIFAIKINPISYE